MYKRFCCTRITFRINECSLPLKYGGGSSDISEALTVDHPLLSQLHSWSGREPHEGMPESTFGSTLEENTIVNLSYIFQNSESLVGGLID